MKKSIRSALIAIALLTGSSAAQADATADLWAALKGSNDAAALAAIKKGADVNKVGTGTLGTPLQLAACFAEPDIVKALIDAKSNVNFVEPTTTYTPLLSALQWGNLEAAKLLLAAGANLKYSAKTTNALGAALASSRLETIKLVLDAGENPSAPMMVAGVQFTPWIMFAERSLTPKEMVTRLQNVQIPFLKNVLQITPPAWVASQTEASFAPLGEVTALLLSKGAQINEVHPGLGTALFVAAKRGKIDIVKALIDGKANLEILSFAGGTVGPYMLTPLMYAAALGQNDVVELLCAAGAQVNTPSQHRVGSGTATATTTTLITKITTHTAVSLASEFKHPDTVAILRKHGGKGPSEP